MKRLRRKKQKRQIRDIIKMSILRIVVLLVIVGLNWTGLSAVGETIAYFFDNEDSNVNTFTASTLDLTVRSGQGNFVPGADNMTPGKQVNRDIYVGETAFGLPLKHNVSFEFAGGNIDLCNQLNLKIWYNHYHGPTSGGYANRDMRLKYNGPLSSLTNQTDVDFEIPHPDDQFDTNPSDGIEQWFYYSIILPNTVADSFQGEVCSFNFVFNAWQDNLAYLSGGFTDTEKLSSIIKAGYWNPPVVLNEFLPNARNYPEFIELYNKTASPIDLNGFYIKANGNIIPIDTTTTSAYSGGSTMIPANGWLVVTTGGDKINDSSGTVTLYNPNDIKVDSYAYGTPDHNINNTPGWTNNLVGYWPFDGNFEDKSGNSNNGTNYGATSVAGKINEGLSFNGTDNYVSVANNDIFDFGSGEFSIESWIKTTSTLRQWITTRYEYYGPGWGLGTQNGHALGYIRTAESGTGKKEIEGTVNVSDDSWHHIVMVRTGDKIKLYTDGVFEKEGILAGNVNDDESIEVGRISFEGGSQYMSGLIDEVKIYNRALDATEISEHYNDVGSSPGAVPPDKSYARIPDGTGSWYDPIPTPGGQNILEEVIPEEEQIVEEEEQATEETTITDEATTSEEINAEATTSEEITIEENAVGTTTDETSTTAENQEEGVLDKIVNEIIEEIMPEEASTTEELMDEELFTPETSVIEETIIEETPAIEEQPVITAEDNSVEQAPPADNSSDGSDDRGGDTSSSLDSSSSAEGAGESSGDSGVDAGGESVSE